MLGSFDCFNVSDSLLKVQHQIVLWRFFKKKKKKKKKNRYITNLMANANCAAKRQSLENCTEFFFQRERVGNPGISKRFN